MSNSWWANKLGTQQPAPAQRPAQPYVPQQPYVPPQNMYPSQIGTPPVQPQMPVTQRCPNCASGNYGGSTPETRPRCYDCGYPITQSGTGMPGVRVPSNGATEAAKQLNTGNNFNPGVIVDRIG